MAWRSDAEGAIIALKGVAGSCRRPFDLGSRGRVRQRSLSLWDALGPSSFGSNSRRTARDRPAGVVPPTHPEQLLFLLL